MSIVSATGNSRRVPLSWFPLNSPILYTISAATIVPLPLVLIVIKQSAPVRKCPLLHSAQCTAFLPMLALPPPAEAGELGEVEWGITSGWEPMGRAGTSYNSEYGFYPHFLQPLCSLCLPGHSQYGYF